jgi:sulfur-carrier protein adenylyltransferase/sulfurtransferase
MEHTGLDRESAPLSHEEILRYTRHLIMPEVGLVGQRRLKASSVLLVGTGGLGSPAGLYLAAAGVGRIGLVDYDVVDPTNLQRQILHGTSSLGERKVVSARRRLLDVNPLIEVQAFDEPFTSDSAFRIAEGYDLIIDGSDNFPTRYLVNDLSVLTHRPNVYGSVFRFEGQVSVFWADRGPCYRCLFPEPPPPGLVPSCAEGGVFGVLPGAIGTLQATEALKILLDLGEPLIGTLLLLDALEMSFERVRLRKNPRCKVCSESPEVTSLVDYEAWCGVPGHDRGEAPPLSAWDIGPTELARRLAAGEKMRIIDVREPHELQVSRLPQAELIPLGSLPSRMDELDMGEEIVFVCRVGVRSTQALQLMVSAGFRKVKNLRGGMNEWARQVDPSIPVY